MTLMTLSPLKMTTGQDYFEEKHYFQLVNIRVFRHCNVLKILLQCQNKL